MKTSYFNPEVHSFPFSNYYLGVCGGMCCTALIEFYKGSLIGCKYNKWSYDKSIIFEQVNIVCANTKKEGLWGQTLSAIDEITKNIDNYHRPTLLYLDQQWGVHKDHFVIAYAIDDIDTNGNQMVFIYDPNAIYKLHFCEEPALCSDYYSNKNFSHFLRVDHHNKKVYKPYSKDHPIINGFKWYGAGATYSLDNITGEKNIEHSCNITPILLNQSETLISTKEPNTTRKVVYDVIKVSKRGNISANLTLYLQKNIVLFESGDNLFPDNLKDFFETPYDRFKRLYYKNKKLEKILLNLSGQYKEHIGPQIGKGYFEKTYKVYRDDSLANSPILTLKSNFIEKSINLESAMSEMITSQVKIAVGINTDLIGGIITSLYEKGILPSKFSYGHYQADIHEPIVQVKNFTENTHLGLKINGKFKTQDADAIDFKAWLKLKPYIKEIPGKSPVAAFKVDIDEEYTPADIRGLIGAFTNEIIKKIVEDMDIPIFDPLISKLESSIFGDKVPNRSTWSRSFYLGKPSEIECNSDKSLPTTGSLMATIALPGYSANIRNNPSILPEGTGIQIIVSRDAMDKILAKNAHSKIGKSIEVDNFHGKYEYATINSLYMKMFDMGIEVKGNTKISGHNYKWDGISRLYFSKLYSEKGSIRWRKANVYYYSRDIIKDQHLNFKLHRLLSTAINPVTTFHEEVANALSSMIKGVCKITNDEEIPFMEFGQSSWVYNGFFTYSNLAFAGLNHDVISKIEYDKFEIKGACGQSIGSFKLKSGYKLHPEELGRLLRSGIVKIPNVHGVKSKNGFYVRANPNKSKWDNLVDPSDITVDFK